MSYAVSLVRRGVVVSLGTFDSMRDVMAAVRAKMPRLLPQRFAAEILDLSERPCETMCWLPDRGFW